MCNLYRVQGNTEPLSLIDELADAEDLIWSEDWVLPFTRPWMPIILSEPRRAALASWTLMPPWVKKDDAAAIKKQSRMTANARSETLFELASFKNAARSARCLVPATAFREWQWQDPQGKTKIPHDIFRHDGRPFLMAGLYSLWNGELTFTIVTKPANALMSRIHNGVRSHTGQVDPRMPVIIEPDQAPRWLTPSGREALEDFFVPRDDDGLVAVPEKRPGEFDF